MTESPFWNRVQPEECGGASRSNQSARFVISALLVVLILVGIPWIAWPFKTTADNTFTINGRYPLNRVEMTPSACIIRPATGAALGSIFNFHVFSGFRPDASHVDDDDNDAQPLPSVEKFDTEFNAYATRYGRLEVGTSAGVLVNGTTFHDGLIYLYPHTSDLSLFLPKTVLNQLPPITDRQIGIMNAKGDAEIIIEIKAGQITFVRWCWE